MAGLSNKPAIFVVKRPESSAKHLAMAEKQKIRKGAFQFGGKSQINA